jgi:signal transduction histidine kinase
MAVRLAGVLSAQEGERAQLSRTLHDEVGQTLTAIGLQLDVLRLDYAIELPELAQRTAEIQKLLEPVIVRIRDLSHHLNSDIVERAGLPFAMDHLAGKYRQNFSGSLRMLTDPHGRLPRETASAIYRIAEQALDNAVQHSLGGHIEVLLRPSHEMICLEVNDDGIGFDLDAARRSARGLGLFLMEQVAARSGFQLSISSLRGKGTRVKVLVMPGGAASGSRV